MGQPAAKQGDKIVANIGGEEEARQAVEILELRYS